MVCNISVTQEEVMAQGLSISSIGAALDMPPSLARIAKMLLSDRVVSAKKVEEKQLFSEGCGRVYISRLRKFLEEAHGITVQSARGSGYYLRVEDRDLIIKKVEEFNG
jgi:DNA-binding response OmpR family regulator